MIKICLFSNYLKHNFRVTIEATKRIGCKCNINRPRIVDSLLEVLCLPNRSNRVNTPCTRTHGNGHSVNQFQKLLGPENIRILDSVVFTTI